MATIPKVCWQIAAGDNNRNYADICIKFNVILIGPGQNLPWYKEDQENSKSILKSSGWSTRKINNITTFAYEIKENDLVVLRLGVSTVCAVGYVRSGYIHNAAFDDVDGWDVSHVRRVEWLRILTVFRDLIKLIPDH